MRIAGEPVFQSAMAQIKDDTGAQRVLRNAFQSLINISEGHGRRRTEVLNNKDFTHEAKQRQLQEIKDKTLAQVDGVEDLSEPEARMREQLYAVRKPERTDTQELIDFLKNQEIRQLLSDQDGLTIVHLLRKESAEGKDVYLTAVLSDPRGERMGVPSELIESILKERAEREQPELVDQLARVEAVNGAIMGMKGLARTIIESGSQV